MILEKPAVRKAAMPVSVEQYHSLTNAGIIPEQTELIQGVIVERMGKSPSHTRVVEFLVELIRKHLGPKFYVRQEQPVTLSDSEPEPDIAVIQGRREDYFEAHPSRAELIVEVAVSTEEMDVEKAQLYAAAKVPEYWVVIPPKKKILIFRNPVDAEYQERTSVEANNTVVSSRFPDLKFELALAL